MKPIETGKKGETVSLPTVADYLAEICKEDNVDVNEYLAKHNETKTVEVRNHLRNTPYSYQGNVLLNPKMTYTLIDKFKSVWIVLSNLKYSSYNPFDFKTYRECGYWRNDGYYPEKSSTPWQRFRRFIIHQKSEIKWAWNYTPEHIKHFKKNKPRIGWFENKLKDLFFLNWDDNKNQTIKELKENGYQVEDNRIWHEPIPQDDNKRII